MAATSGQSGGSNAKAGRFNKINALAALRKHGIPLSLGLFLTGAAVWTHFGYVTERQSVWVEALKVAEAKVLDVRFRMRGPLKPASKVGILAIDEKSVRAIGRWPFPRTVYEKAFANLKAAGVSWVGMDITWSEPERTLLADVLPSASGKLDAGQWAQIQGAASGPSPGDVSLARAIKDFGNVILGYFYYVSKEEAEAAGSKPFAGIEQMAGSSIQGLVLHPGKEVSSYPMISSSGIAANIPLINQSSDHHAFFNNDPDHDGIIRWITLVRNVDGRLMPSLALKMAASALGREPAVLFDQQGITEINLVNPSDLADYITLPVDPFGGGRAMINHLGGRVTFPHFSFVDAVNNAFTPEQREQLKGGLLLAGPTATGINDIRANSFDAVIDGVENHAAFIDNVISGRFMRRPSTIFLYEFAGIAAIGLLTTILVSFFPASISAAGTALLVLGFLGADRMFWFGKGLWVAAAAPIFTTGSIYLIITTYRYLTEEREKKKVKGAFSMYLSSDVIEQVLDNPDALKLGGEKKELTVFFSDVRDFTTISESMSPEKLCELMNLYFTPMTKIILQSKGVVDKFIGDAIMAFWGAPVELPNTADIACEASLKMLYELDRLRVDFPRMGLPVVDIGIGLNTGPMSVGNMGSDERFCYTVMGDNVNLGSRLEGLTKEYGIKIMLSDRTYAKISRKDFHLRDLDTIRVKGKLEPVRVYELMRPDALGQGRESLLREFTGSFNEARKAYLGRDWARAQKLFMECMTIRPDDKATNLYLERIVELKDMNLDDSWDGVKVFKHK
ncbi:MAG: hypothetical protein RIQ81_2300 [Pseudomonadota bacterium]